MAATLLSTWLALNGGSTPGGGSSLSGGSTLTYALTPAAMPVGLMLAGLLGLAGIVFALQRLRVRHRTRMVVTTLFWREAMEESRARTLVERFRHPLTYLLLLLIASLLWLSVARLESSRAEGTQHTFLLDGSASMAVGARFERAVAALTEALEDVPRERAQVLFCGGTVRTLLLPGEDRALLGARLQGLAPEAAPATVERALVDLALEARGAGPDAGAARRFVVVGDAPVAEEVQESLASADRLERLGTSQDGADAGSDPVQGNIGIVALGAAPAASGVFDAIDLFVEVRGAGAGAGAGGAAPSLSVGGQPVQLAEAGGDASGSLSQWIARDVRPAAFGSGPMDRRALVTLPGEDALEADNRAELQLPELRVIRVYLEPGQSGQSGPSGDASTEALRTVLASDSAVELVAEASRADVVVGGDAGSKPSLRFVPAASQESSIEVVAEATPSTSSSEAQLRSVLGDLALDRIDAARLASEINRPLTARLRAGGGGSDGRGKARVVSLWSELLDPGVCSFTESRAFPVVIGRALRWIADVPEVTPYEAAGRARPQRIVGGSERPMAPWESRPETSAVLSLLDVPSTLRASSGPFADFLDDAKDSQERHSPGPWRPATWILALALVLLAVEWIVYQRGRIA